MTQAYYSLYRMAVFFWILIGLTWIGGVISMITEVFNSSKFKLQHVLFSGPIQKIPRAQKSIRERVRRMSQKWRSPATINLHNYHNEITIMK